MFLHLAPTPGVTLGKDGLTTQKVPFDVFVTQLVWAPQDMRQFKKMSILSVYTKICLKLIDIP